MTAAPPRPQSEPAPKPKSESKPAPKSEPAPGPKSEPKPAPKSEPTPKPKSEPKPAQEPKLETPAAAQVHDVQAILQKMASAPRAGFNPSPASADSSPTPSSDSIPDVGKAWTFGHRNGQPLRWLVLERVEAASSTAYTLICQDAPWVMPYMESEDGDLPETVTWESSTVRRWLNSRFISDTFTPQEQARLIPTSLATVGAEERSTEDRVFLLGKKEFNRYSIAIETLAQAKDASGSPCVWWLRGQKAPTGGRIFVCEPGTSQPVSRRADDSSVCVRPVICVRNNS